MSKGGERDEGGVGVGVDCACYARSFAVNAEQRVAEAAGRATAKLRSVSMTCRMRILLARELTASAARRGRSARRFEGETRRERR